MYRKGSNLLRLRSKIDSNVVRILFQMSIKILLTLKGVRNNILFQKISNPLRAFLNRDSIIISNSLITILTDPNNSESCYKWLHNFFESHKSVPTSKAFQAFNQINKMDSQQNVKDNESQSNIFRFVSLGCHYNSLNRLV